MSEIFSEEKLKLITELISKGDISGWFNSHDGGPYLQEFQRRFAEACKADYAYAVSSGSASIFVALRACGIGIGDLVAVPTYTHIGSVAPIRLTGAEPYFIDCDKYGNISPMDLDLAVKVDDLKFKAVLVVHQLGLPCEMDKIKNACPEALIIEDASHSLGAEYKGYKTGTLGDIGCFSVGGGRTKTIGTGEGGIIVTNNGKIAQRVKNIRNHGDRVSDVDYFCFNFRLSDLNALVGLIQIEKLDRLNKWQINNALYLRKKLPSFLELQDIPEDVKPVHYLVNCFFNEEKAGMTRDEFLQKLKDRNSIGGVPRKNVSGGYSKIVSDIKYYQKYAKQDYLMSMYLRDTSIWIDWHRYNRTKEEIDELINAMKEIV